MMKIVSLVSILFVCCAAVAVKVSLNKPIKFSSLSASYSEAAQKTLSDSGFDVIRAPIGTHALGASRNGCILWAAPSQEDGANDASFVATYGAQTEVVFIFSGRQYPERPNFRTWLERMRVRGLSAVGIDSLPSPVFALSISKDCEEIDRLTAIALLEEVR